MPAFLKSIDAQLKTNKFILGNEITYVDFFVGGSFANWFANPNCFNTDRWAKLLEKFPNFNAYGKRFMG